MLRTIFSKLADLSIRILWNRKQFRVPHSTRQEACLSWINIRLEPAPVNKLAVSAFNIDRQIPGLGGSIEHFV